MIESLPRLIVAGLAAGLLAACPASPQVFVVSGQVSRLSGGSPLIGYAESSSSNPLSPTNPGSYQLEGYVAPDASGHFQLPLTAVHPYALLYVVCWNDQGSQSLVPGETIATPSYVVSVAQGKLVGVLPFADPGGATDSVPTDGLDFQF